MKTQLAQSVASSLSSETNYNIFFFFLMFENGGIVDDSNYLKPQDWACSKTKSLSYLNFLFEEF